MEEFFSSWERAAVACPRAAAAGVSCPLRLPFSSLVPLLLGSVAEPDQQPVPQSCGVKPRP